MSLQFSLSLAVYFFGLSSLFAQSGLKRVVVNASADPEYVEATKNKAYQTYHFKEGKEYRGSKRDSSIDEMSFMDVLEVTADYLNTQGFYPAASTDVGDLLILVSWGNTTLDTDWNALTGVTDFGNANAGNASAPDGPAQSQGEAQAMQALQAAAEAEASAGSFIGGGPGTYQRDRNLRLLGFDKGLYGEKTSRTERERLNWELDRERYFIILNAFDYQLLMKEQKVKQLWSCRISTRNLGTNFTDALQFMNKAAAPAFGKNIDQLLTPRMDPSGNVEFGELEVLGTED